MVDYRTKKKTINAYNLKQVNDRNMNINREGAWCGEQSV